MITEPLRYVADFVKAGADILVFHVESQAPDKTLESLRKIKALGARTGSPCVRKRPGRFSCPIWTSWTSSCDDGGAGLGGQSFMEDQLPKIAALRREIDRRGIKCELEVDGINPETARLCVEAGADVGGRKRRVWRT